ncbi:diguanylate cyclase (GGDEF) domain-containing protein [Lachnospiraceae bacterium XBB1006]|nr:diguanylate cyclase (GGDEF) domain-containing protein [Lachnospiraceae bacterium XBB1006]
MDGFMENIEKKWKSLSLKLPILYTASTLLVVVIVLVSVYFQFEKQMIREFTQMAQGVTRLMAREIDTEKIDDYIERNFKMKEYREIRAYFTELEKSYPGIEYMYVYHFQEDGGLVIFDMDDLDGEGQGDEPGTIYPYDKAYVPYKEKLMKGQYVPVQSDVTQYGYLLTYMQPLFDEKGNYVCHVCVDFSMDRMHMENVEFLLTLGLVLAIVVTIILVAGIRAMRKGITGPLNHISKCTESFKYDTEEDRLKNIQMMEQLDIPDRNEIGRLYQIFTSTLKESHYYMTNFSKAKNDIQTTAAALDQMSESAMRDVLTHVGSKFAYEAKAKEIEEEIENGEAKFAIVMVDVNNLKYVNDTFGHKEGDRYIQGCCKIVCDVYKHSPVFRVGGDEFVAVLRGEDYDNREAKLAQARVTFMEAFLQKNKETWERYSASVGMASFGEGDTNVEDVFKRADAAMYDYKVEFKKKYGSYR